MTAFILGAFFLRAAIKRVKFRLHLVAHASVAFLHATKRAKHSGSALASLRMHAIL